MNQPTNLSPEVCPLCSQPNQCALEIERATGQKQPPCWCTQASFSAELLACISDAARNQACLCKVCSADAAATGLRPAGSSKLSP